jgi:PKD repeat protein
MMYLSFNQNSFVKFLCFIFAIFLIGSCKKKELPPVADFTIENNNCSAICTVLFLNKSTGAGNVYKWNFGDSTAISTEENASHVYKKEGSYFVKLEIANVNGVDDATKVVIITSAVVAKPTANFTFNNGGCTAPCTVTFTNTSQNATTYLWNFGNGNTSTAKEPSATFQTAGTYTVTLKITGNNNVTDEMTKQITINGTVVKPIANFTFTNNNCTAPCAVAFTNSSQNATTYFWDFGDGSTSTLTSPSHTYQQGGNYSVLLKASTNTSSEQIVKVLTINAPSTKKAKILSFKCYSLPLNINWDPDDFTGPDVRNTVADLVTTQKVTESQSPIYNVTQSSLPLTWTFSSPFIIDNTHAHCIKYWDDDFGSFQFMGESTAFKLSDYSSTQPSFIDINNGNIQTRVYLVWE